MEFFCFLAIAALLSIASTEPTEKSEFRVRAEKTVNATGIKTYQFPYLVNVQGGKELRRFNTTRRSFGDGVIIAPQWVLLTTHLFRELKWSATKINVLAGTIDSTDYNGPTSQFIKVAKIFRHPEKISNFFHYTDILLLKLIEPLKMGKNVQAVGLPKFHEKVEGTGIAAGWDDIFRNQDGRSEDFEYNEFSFEDGDCWSYLNRSEGYKCGWGYRTSGCTEFLDRPFTYYWVQKDMSTGNVVLTGISSPDEDPFCEPPPIMFIRASDYVTWINETMENNLID